VSNPFADAFFPRAPLIGAALLIGFALLSAVLVRATGIGASRSPDAAPVAVREFRFVDHADGSIAVYDPRTDRLLDTVAPGSNGFLRGTLRGLSRERKRQGKSADHPFRLIARADGRLTLEDDTTGRRVDLEAFGPTNAGAFAKFLLAGNATP
jgi:putative photosynthetic complex assembly protein